MPWVRQDLNEGMLAEYLAGEFCSNTETLWSAVMRLAPGHAMTATHAGVARDEYWHPDIAEMLRLRDDEEWFSYYFELLADSVSRSSRTLGRAGCEVSGGLDSSAVFCMAHHLRRNGRLRAGELDGYTLAFDREGPANEIAYARSVGSHLDVAIHEVSPDIKPLSWYEERAQTTRTFPGYPNGVMSHGVLRRARQSGCRVMLNGIGGDEWLGGSRVYYAEHLAAREWRCLLNSARDDVRAYGVPQTLSWVSRQGVFPLLPRALQSGGRRLARRRAAGAKAAGRADWLSPETRERLEARMAVCASAGDLKRGRVGHQAMFGYLRDAHHHHATEMTEQFGAEHGIEIRRPLYTQALVQFAFSTPERMRLRGSRNKFMHVNALRGVMPQVVLERQDKAEFSVVFDEHLKDMKSYFAERVASRRPEWLAGDGMKRLFEEYENNPTQKWPIWALWGVFGCDKFIPGADWQGCRQPAA
jgi:asparagine synthase (glutamine-hydrolysing)